MNPYESPRTIAEPAPVVLPSRHGIRTDAVMGICAALLAWLLAPYGAGHAEPSLPTVFWYTLAGAILGCVGSFVGRMLVRALFSFPR